MAVQTIKQYRQQNGVDILKVFTKPTKVFPEGKNHFYCPAEAIDIVQSHTWRLDKYRNRVYVITTNYYGETLRFHRELCYFYHIQYSPYIDHINMVEIDNTDSNLNIVTNQQNQLNHFTRGYQIRQRSSKAAFQPYIMLSGRVYYPYSCIPTEVEACQLTNIMEQIWLREQLGNDYYMFNFQKYRRHSEDILDLERTGQISEEEATKRHLLKYADNAWYVYRYNLLELFNYFHIPVPKYSLDSQGFMCHPITGQKLCPFPFNGK